VLTFFKNGHFKTPLLTQTKELLQQFNTGCSKKPGLSYKTSIDPNWWCSGTKKIHYNDWSAL